MVASNSAALVGHPCRHDAFGMPFRACTPPSAPLSWVARTRPRARPSSPQTYPRPVETIYQGMKKWAYNICP